MRLQIAKNLKSGEIAIKVLDGEQWDHEWIEQQVESGLTETGLWEGSLNQMSNSVKAVLSTIADIKLTDLKFRAYKEEAPLKSVEVEPVRLAIETLLKSLHPDSFICIGCSTHFDITDLEVNMYDHENGYKVGLKSKQWLSIHCDHCGHETSFVKLQHKDRLVRNKRNNHYYDMVVY